MRAVTGLVRFSDGLNRVALALAVVALVVMAASAGYQVIARYIFDAPPIWTEELARRAMVWAGMLGASVAFHERSDPTLFPGVARTTGGLGRLLAVVRAAGVTIFAVPVLFYSVFGANWALSRGFLGRSLGREAEMLSVPMVWFTAAVPVAFLIILVHTAASLALHLATGAPPPDRFHAEDEPA
ncbi:TRAP transporter small permease [Amorphus coralli]|uniref:TRAP transporter small permease n=1 Tax=Amorphus coralli TaxID=340680 RepID=UPI000368CBB3|nr:TRAP transporter small permease [Amorphus coralli]